MDFTFANAYLDNIIIFSITAEEHLTHIQQVFKKTKDSTPLNETQQMLFFSPMKIPEPRTHSQHKRHLTTSIRNSSYQEYASTENAQTGMCFFQLSQILQEIYQEFCLIAKYNKIK